MTGRMGSITRAALIVIGLGWLFVVVMAYYVYHRPLDANTFLDVWNVLQSYAVVRPLAPSIVPAVGNTLGDIAVIALLLLLAAAVGHRLLRTFRFESDLEALGIRTGFGLGFLGFVGFVLGTVGLVQPLVFWAVLVLGLAILHRDVLALVRSLRAIELPRGTRGERLLALFVVLNLAITFVFALTPPTGWDALAYHLPLPKTILALGHFPAPSDNLPFQYPALVEMLFLFAMGLKSDAVAQGLHWVFFVLTLALLLAFSGRYLTWRVGWLAVALLAAVPSILLLSTYAYNDLALMFYAFASFYWTWRALETGRIRDFLLSGALAGMAMGEKYTAVIVPFALGALVLFRSGLPTGRSVRDALVLGTSALALAAPWLVRNALTVGNPVYPFIGQGLYWDEFRTLWITRFGSGLASVPLELVAVPWTITVQGIQGGAFDATIGPFLLAFLPFSLLRGNPEGSRPARALAFVALALFGFWLMGVAQSNLLWQTRFLFPAFPFFSLLAAEGWNRLAQLNVRQFSLQRFAGLVLALALGLNLLSNVLVMVRNRQLDVLLGLESRQEFLARNLGAHYAAAQWVNANLPSNAQVVSLWEPRAYYMERAVEPDSILDRFAHLQFRLGDADKIADEWQQRGLTHVLLWRAGLNDLLQSGYDPIGEREMSTLHELEAKRLHLVYDHAPLGLTIQNARPALTDWEAEPYAIYEIR